MRPRTDHVPKTLIPVNGRPFAEWQLNWLASQGVTRVIYSIGHLGGQIRSFVGDGSHFGLTVEYVEDGASPMGTGGALRRVAESRSEDPHFLVLNGDSYLQVTLASVVRAFLAQPLPALMTVLRNRDQWDRSNAVVRGGLVVLYEKGRAHRTGLEWIDYGLLAVARQVLLDRLPANEECDIAGLMHQLSIEHSLVAYEVTERFYEIGSASGLHDLESILRSSAD